ncbi:hypothetical protein LZQ00_05520 [Sphingobacterium sp. SRCM116780]|uniref:hypothetical protein n=1 Tax=Sphingobacterium sp. SRCM116780 TaxID=2907623 RepID=UPI001F469421|nr:hypothetical protein [Sphingobacterium sp. SRCM116780]UIR57273.1 hypothetical protein LZQ00_05520 [Sphingobacterium sp. SRCM116780]
MKNSKRIAIIIFLSFGILYSCQNNKEGSDNKIPPSAGDNTRYNLSEQQEMSMQSDTLKTDSATIDSLANPH